MVIGRPADTSVGFCTKPLPCGGGYTFTLTTLLGSFIAELEGLYGPRDMSYTPLGIEFYGDVPHLWYPGNRKHVSIVLSESCRADVDRAIFQLAHEAVHLLSPSGSQNAPVVEEGLATLFAAEVSLRHCLGMHSDGLRSYTQAAMLTRFLLDIDPTIIRRAREQNPYFYEWTSETLSNLIDHKDISLLADVLCRRFYRDLEDALPINVIALNDERSG